METFYLSMQAVDPRIKILDKARLRSRSVQQRSFLYTFQNFEYIFFKKNTEIAAETYLEALFDASVSRF